MNYPNFQIETLVIIDAVHAFDELLAEHHFTIVTDHESLTHMRKQKHLGSRQQCWVDFLSRYDFDIIYRKGKTNYLADALSRLHEGEPTPTDHYLKDPTDDDTESDTDTTTSSQYSAMTSSKTSYGSGSWDAQDEQRMIDLTQEAEAAEQQTELDYNPSNQTFDSDPRPCLCGPDIVSYFTT